MIKQELVVELRVKSEKVSSGKNILSFHFLSTYLSLLVKKSIYSLIKNSRSGSKRIYQGKGLSLMVAHFSLNTSACNW